MSDGYSNFRSYRLGLEKSLACGRFFSVEWNLVLVRCEPIRNRALRDLRPVFRDCNIAKDRDSGEIVSFEHVQFPFQLISLRVKPPSNMSSAELEVSHLTSC